jgi:hypothetical protein
VTRSRDARLSITCMVVDGLIDATGPVTGYSPGS